jgi:hypothetical protein
VLTGDQRPCWVNDSFFGLDVSTRVTGGGFSTRANVKGEYALIGPAQGTFRITARCEDANAGAPVTLANSPIRQDIVFDNRAPWPCGTSGDTPNLMLGLAGIGYFYLRLAIPAIPSILLLRREAFAYGRSEDCQANASTRQGQIARARRIATT